MVCCCRGHNRMRPVFGASFICDLKFLGSGNYYDARTHAVRGVLCALATG